FSLRKSFLDLGVKIAYYPNENLSGFFLHQFVLVSILFGLFNYTGEMVQNQGVKVNFTRKINHFATFFCRSSLASMSI
ncbi:MAG TPA: hypothetical protein PKM50_02075, partial [Methanoregula sp.]|nr:hypothetical protein [Methanoregula sp.]